MSEKKPFKQTFGMSEDEYDKLYPPKKESVKMSKKDEDLSRLAFLLGKLEATHHLDELEKSEVRGLVKRTNNTLKDTHMDYLGLKKKRSSKVLLLVGVSALLVALIAYTSYAANINKQKLADIESAKAAKLAEDPISSSGVYTAVNTLRSKSGAQALANVSALTAAAQQGCDDMVVSGYFDYKNPTSGKTQNSRITDNQGSLYFKTYVSSIYKGDSAHQTAKEIAEGIMSSQATNVGNPVYNSVGWAVCSLPTSAKTGTPLDWQGPDATVYIVGMLAEKADKPVAPVNNYVAPRYVAPTPIYTPPKTTRTNCTSDFLGIHCTSSTY